MGIQRRTKSLDAVLSAFGDSNEALSARKLLDRLGEGVNKTTVYRLLDRLEDDGIVHSFVGEDSVTYYAKCPDVFRPGAHPQSPALPLHLVQHGSLPRRRGQLDGVWWLPG